MHERPGLVDDGDVLAEVRRGWDERVDTVSYLPVGFGAHHWAAYQDRQPRLFVTLDRVDEWRDAYRLEAAYASAVALHDSGLEFVVAALVGASGATTVPFGEGRLSCTPWRDGGSGGSLDLSWTQLALTRLHDVPPPEVTPVWRPLVRPDFADRTGELTGRSWGPGPYADAARQAVRERLTDVARWTDRYHRLADAARDRAWVANHGEPSSHDQLLTASGRLLVDWESLTLAPPELDLRLLVEGGMSPHEVGADPEMLELFDLEWRLDEISQYAAWFAAPHVGTRDDEIAFGGLRHELTRP
ncbi:MAG TPA: hypothetical protein VGK78_20065 [Nocardioides sp.]|uniref:hypothetical protein n=1 Tax=Nocardioides sp. TaxID=35761 RepID=UPI002F3E9748